MKTYRQNMQQTIGALRNVDPLEREELIDILILHFKSQLAIDEGRCGERMKPGICQRIAGHTGNCEDC